MLRRALVEFVLHDTCKKASLSFSVSLPQDDQAELDAIWAADLTQSQDETGHPVFSRRSKQNDIRWQLSLDNQSGTTVMSNLFKRFAADESGATAIEYGLIAALVAVAIIGGLQALTTDLRTAFTNVGTAIAGR